MTILSLKNIEKNFGAIQALTGVSFDINEAETVGLMGDNGAGKTNILDAIHYLSQTKSYFNHIDSQNIKFDEDYFIPRRGGETGTMIDTLDGQNISGDTNDEFS